MSVTFNADEIFEIAEAIESNGARFYRKAAESFTDQSKKQLLLDMAEMEDGHRQTNLKIRETLKQQQAADVFDPDQEAKLYLRALADGHIFDVHKDPCEQLKGDETIQQIIKMAIGLEKDSIIFYLGLKDMAPSAEEKAKIENIIKEEMSHISLLNKKLASLA